MSNVSHRIRRAHAKAAPAPRVTHEYEITHPTHKPDLRGEFAGQKVYFKGDKQFVRLTDAQAKFYLDQGVLAKVVVQH